MFISTKDLLLNPRYEIYRIPRSIRPLYYSSDQQRMNDKITVICEGGWKYTGTLTNPRVTLLGRLDWLEIQTKNGIIKINAPYIVAIIYGNTETSRKRTKGN